MPLSTTPTERFFRSVLPLMLLTLDGEVQFANAATGTLLDSSPDDLQGDTFGGLCFHEDLHGWTQQLQRARLGEPGGQTALRLRARSGRVVPCEFTWSLLLDDDQQPSYLSVVLIDRTDQVEAERRLASSESRWRAILGRTADALWLSDDDGLLLDVPFGLGRPVSGRGWRGRRIHSYVHAADRERFDAAFAAVADGSVPQVSLELRVQDDEGAVRWVNQTVTDLREHPDVGALVGNVVDISALRAQRAAAQRSAQMFEARFHRSHLPQAVIDLTASLTDVNDALCSLLGTSRAELLGRPMIELVHPDESRTPVPALVELLMGLRETAEVERVLLGRGGRPLPVRVDATLLRDETGTAYGASAHLQDLSLLHESERRRRRQEDFHTALDTLGHTLTLIVDADDQVVYVSPHVSDLLGVDAADLADGGARTLRHPDDVHRMLSAFQRVKSGGPPETVLARARTADGRYLWLEETYTNMLRSPLGGIVMNLRDVTESVEARAALSASERRFRTMAESAHEGMWLVSVDGQTLFHNQQLLELVGPLDAAPARDLARQLAEHLDRDARFEVDHEVPGEPELRCLRISAGAFPLEDGGTAVLAMVMDHTDTRRAEQELRHAALHDALTGLPNRTLALDRLEHALARPGHRAAVLLVDLDRFQQLNDARGHDTGDRILMAAAGAVLSSVAEGDTVARVGSDEFLVVCEDATESAALQVGHDVLAALAAVTHVDGQPVHLSASIGVTTGPGSASDLLRFADTAMHAARRSGGSRVRRFEPAFARRAEESDTLALALRDALADGQLSLHYQPVVDLASGGVLGAEALLRWTHQGVVVPPQKFVAIAESNGLSASLDRWVIATALREFAALSTAGHVPAGAYVAVNLCAANLGDSLLESFLLEQVQQSGLRPGAVVLEITEGAIMDDPKVAVALLGALRGHGFRVAIDDFGTGYSSLAYLRDLPVTALKIDKSFVDDVPTSADARAIASSMVELARAVGLDVVAEGVESREQLSALRALGCRAGQGWLWSRAVPASAFAERGLGLQSFDVTGGQVPVLDVGPTPHVQEEHGLALMTRLRAQGASLATTAAALNRQGFRTPTGLRWHSASVAKALAAPPSR